MKTNELKIFLVDDDAVNLKNNFSYLQQAGYSAHTFGNGNQCVDHLDEQPDVILLAYGSSTQMGLDALRQIKAFNPAVQVVLLPGVEYLNTLNTSDKAQNKAAGVQHNGYLVAYINLILSRLFPKTVNAA